MTESSHFGLIREKSVWKNFRIPKKEGITACLNTLVPKACYPSYNIAFSLPSNVKIVECSGDEIGVSSIS